MIEISSFLARGKKINKNKNKICNAMNFRILTDECKGLKIFKRKFSLEVHIRW